VLIAGFPSDATGTNCWVVAPGDGEQCVVIDPGMGIGPRLDDLIEQHRLHPVAVLLTHGHFDHTYSVLPVCQARNIPAFIHPADRDQLTDPWTAIGLPVGAPVMGLEKLVLAEPDDVREMFDGECIALAGLEFVVSHAPGHSLGSVVFELGATLFSGDVLFAGSVGRTDFPGGSMPQLLDSLRRVVLPLDDATEVHTGHGPSTTVGRERATNPYLRGLEPR
jgi:hydroxyacylglutathione hydrolase